MVEELPAKQLVGNPGLQVRILCAALQGDASLWQPSYFIATTGTTVREKVREYIDSQKTDEHRRKYEKTGRYSKKRRR